MGKLVYIAIASLDGYIADEQGKFDWAVPDAEVHQFVNDLTRPVGTYLYGRRMYEVMKYWERALDEPGHGEVSRDFARVWLAADKVVFSRTLKDVETKRTRIERRFDPEALRRMKEESARDLSIGGPELAAYAFRSGLVDECHLVLAPIIVGGGNRALPDRAVVKLALEDERRFGNGMVYLRYRTTG